MLSHRPFARVAQVIVLPARASRAATVEREGREPAAVIEVPFVRMGLRPRRGADRRSTSREIQDVLAEETRRGVRRAVL